MTPTDKPKPKLLVNGTKHASLKRWAHLPYIIARACLCRREVFEASCVRNVTQW
jgi:hypothetical protein